MVISVVFWTKLDITRTQKSCRIFLCNIRNFSNCNFICLNNHDLYFRDDFEIAKIRFHVMLVNCFWFQFAEKKHDTEKT
jgi:hypothetical protein